MRQGITFMFIAAIALTGCETMDSAMTGIGDGARNVGNRIASIDFSVPAFGRNSQKETITDNSNMATTKAAADATCPPVTTIEDLKQISQFESPSLQIDDTLISHAEITRVSSDCTINDYNVAIEINMMFSGNIGPKGKVTATDEANFSYPYFVALTSENGETLAKEVFTANLSYKGEQIEAMTTDNMRQIIPLDEQGHSTVKEIMIGFQLDEDELSYNREHPVDPFADIMPYNETQEPEIIDDVDFGNDSLSIFGK